MFLYGAYVGWRVIYRQAIGQCKADVQWFIAEITQAPTKHGLFKIQFLAPKSRAQFGPEEMADA